MDLRISFQHISHSDALEAGIKEKAEKMRLRFPKIISCSAVAGQENGHGDKQFFLRLDITVPGHEIAVSSARHSDAHIALRDAFEAAWRQMESIAEKTRENRHKQ